MKTDIFTENKKYNIIYADPPWEYSRSGGMKKGRGMAKQHYATMKTADICALPIRRICTADAICFMWATFPNIGEALKVMTAWGFTYKTAAFVWVKRNKCGSPFWGMGQYTRANAEICLLGISEKTKANAIVKSHAVHQLIEAIPGRHSEKPPETRERIIQLTGGGRSAIELFARQAVDGWDCWGNEV
nr:MAG TPA: N6 adenosine methyltransferase subunit [Caudoviricetes sp.]